jgi:hypothetical protein
VAGAAMSKAEGVRLAAATLSYAASTCSSPTNGDLSSSSNGDECRRSSGATLVDALLDAREAGL